MSYLKPKNNYWPAIQYLNEILARKQKSLATPAIFNTKLIQYQTYSIQNLFNTKLIQYKTIFKLLKFCKLWEALNMLKRSWNQIKIATTTTTLERVMWILSNANLIDIFAEMQQQQQQQQQIRNLQRNFWSNLNLISLGKKI